VSKLISLVSGPDPQIAEAARAALVSVGVPVSQDPAMQRQMLTELQKRGSEAYCLSVSSGRRHRVRELETDLPSGRSATSRR